MARALRLAGGFIAVAALCVGSLGCGGASSKRVVVSGTVTYAGKFVEEGTITSSEVNSAGTVEGPIRNGRYRLVGVVPGKNLVFVKSTTSAARLARREEAPADMFRRGMGEVNPGPGKKLDPEMDKKFMELERMDGNSIPKDARGNNEEVDIPAEGRILDISLEPPS